MHLSLLPQQQKALEIRLIYLSLFLQLRKAFLLLTCINLHAKAKARLYEALFQRNLISATKLSADVFSYTFPLLNLHVVFALALHHRFSFLVPGINLLRRIADSHRPIPKIIRETRLDQPFDDNFERERFWV